MAKTFYVSPGRAYVVAAASGTKITTKDGTTLETVPSNAKFVILSVSVNEIIVNDDNAKVQQMYSAAAGSTSSSSGGAEGPSIRFEVVQTLPATGEDGIIYLKPTGDTGDNKYEEWVWVNGEYEQMGSAKLDLDGYAVLSGGNEFSGDQEITGDVHVTGSLTIDGEGSINSGNTAYEIAETADSTITPQAGTWTRYTGSETSLTIEEPAWTGEVEISYLETASPVTLTGVKWSPAAPVLTGDGPFVYTLVHSREGEVLAGAYGYSTPTAEAIQKVVPISWYDQYTTPAEATRESSIALGQRAWAKSAYTTALGVNTGCYGNCSTSVGNSTVAQLGNTTAIGAYFANGTSYIRTTSEAPQTVVVGNGAQILNPKNDDGTPVLDSDGNQIVSSNSVTIGTGATCNNLDSVVIGANAQNKNSSTDTKTGIAIGAGASVSGGGSNIAVGTNANATGLDIAIGCETRALGGKSVVIGSRSINNGAQQTTILGMAAKITNTTAADGTIIRSENSTVLGYGASASAPNAVVLGANASTAGEGTIIIGAGTSLAAGSGNITNAILIGRGAKSAGDWASGSIALGTNSTVRGDASYAIGSGSASATGGMAIGTGAKAGEYSTAFGYQCINRNNGTMAFRQETSRGETYTQFYIMAAESPLAVQYEEGEACMGYVVKNKTTGELLAAGTQKLSVLFPNNSTFQPAMLGLDDEYVPPKVFHPSDLDMPIEEPTAPEDVEINIPEPEPEEYTPLPVYPIVEPEIPTEEQ